MLNLAVFLLFAALVIAAYNPKSMNQVWLVTLSVTFFVPFALAITFLALTNNYYPMAKIGHFFGSNAVYIIILGVTLFYFLKKKYEDEDDFKFPPMIILAVIISAMIGIYQFHKEMQSREAAERYMELERKRAYDTDLKIGKTEKPEESTSESAQVHQHMIESAKNYNDELPEEIGFGMTMIKCEIIGYSMVYTIQWKGMKKSDFTAENIKELKADILEYSKEENTLAFKTLLNYMNEYGYELVYEYVNERNEDLCCINIKPSEFPTEQPQAQ